MSNQAFEDWKRKALECDILAEAQTLGATLKRAGREWVGPCPACGGTDRFSISPAKRIFNCRGAVGGDVIKMIEHINGCSFMQAVEALTGEPPPNGRVSKPVTWEDRQARAKRKEEAEAKQAKLEAEQLRYEGDTHEAAMAIWYQSKPLTGTVAETYLNRRGIPTPDAGWDLVFRFHPALPYPSIGKMPALVCRVDDVLGELTAISRIYLRADGSGKADVENPKLTLGPSAGGAVRIGGVGPDIHCCEGIETGLAIRCLTNHQRPVWPTLGTSGLAAVEIPIGVRRVTIWPDGDKPMRQQDGEYVPSIPAGRRAAESLLGRLRCQRIRTSVASEPPPSMDYLNLWLEHQRGAAA